MTISTTSATYNAAIPAKKRTVWYVLIALILLLAFTIRVWNLTKESFWADEGWTMMLAKGPTFADVVKTMAEDQHPPLYFLLMHYWIDLAGNSEFTTRYLSLAWSVLGVALIYRLGADTFSPEVGAVGALLLALADNDTFLAQDARHYTQMAALATASALFYLRYYRRPSRGNGLMWLISSIALMYTHYLGAFVLLVQFIHMLIFARPLRRLGDMMFRLAMVGVAWLPWAVVFIGQSMVRYTRPILYQSTLEYPKGLSLIRGDLIGYQWGITGGLLLLGLIYVTYTNGKAKFKLHPLWNTVYMLLWLALPIILMIAIQQKFPILTTRNFLLVTPVIALLIAHGIFNLNGFARVFLLVMLVSVDLLTVDAYLAKPPWRDVAQDILQYRSADEPILLDVWTDDFALRYHIGRGLHTDPDNVPMLSMTEWRFQYLNAFYPTLLDYLQKHGSGFWLAYWGPENGEFLQWIAQQGYTRTAEQMETHLETNKIFVYRYDKVDQNTPVQAHFGDQFDLVTSSITRTVENGATTLHVNALWKVKQVPPVDYSFSAFVLTPSGQMVINDDAAPLKGKGETSKWKVGDLQFDIKTLTLPANLPAGDYIVGLKIYWYVDQKPLPVTANGSTGQATEYYQVGTVQP